MVNQAGHGALAGSGDPPERYAALAPTDYDMARRAFCRMSKEERRAQASSSSKAFTISPPASPDSTSTSAPTIRSSTFRRMAIANGVGPGDTVLRPCRENGQRLEG
jgi:hypothetical protein